MFDSKRDRSAEVAEGHASRPIAGGGARVVHGVKTRGRRRRLRTRLRVAGASVADRSQADCPLDGRDLDRRSRFHRFRLDERGLELCGPFQDRRPSVIIHRRAGSVQRCVAGSWRCRGRVAFAVEPAVAVGQRREGRTPLAWICIPRPGVLCEHCSPPLPLNGMALSRRTQRDGNGSE